MSRFDTPESEKERRKRESWGGGWRLNYDSSNVKTPGVPNLKQPQPQKQQDDIPVRQSKPKPILHDSGVRAIRTPAMPVKTKRKENYTE